MNRHKSHVFIAQLGERQTEDLEVPSSIPRTVDAVTEILGEDKAWRFNWIFFLPSVTTLKHSRRYLVRHHAQPKRRKGKCTVFDE